MLVPEDVFDKPRQLRMLREHPAEGMAGGIGNHPFVYPDNHPGADYGNGVWVDVIQPERRGGAP